MVNKYGARKTPCHHGHTHDSAREAKRCNELHLLKRAGKIDRLEVQRQFWFEIDGKQLKYPKGRRAGFKVDFFYMEVIGPPEFGGRYIAEDAKGFTVRDYPLRAALFRALNPQIELREV